MERPVLKALEGGRKDNQFDWLLPMEIGTVFLFRPKANRRNKEYPYLVDIGSITTKFGDVCTQIVRRRGGENEVFIVHNIDFCAENDKVSEVEPEQPSGEDGKEKNNNEQRDRAD